MAVDCLLHLARAAHEGSDTDLMVGHSHHASHEWLSTLLAIRLSLYPKLRVRLATRFQMELLRGVLAGELGVLLHHLWVSGEVYEPLHNSHQRAMPAAA